MTREPASADSAVASTPAITSEQRSPGIRTRTVLAPEVRGASSRTDWAARVEGRSSASCLDISTVGTRLWKGLGGRELNRERWSLRRYIVPAHAPLNPEFWWISAPPQGSARNA